MTLQTFQPTRFVRLRRLSLFGPLSFLSSLLLRTLPATIYFHSIHSHKCAPVYIFTSSMCRLKSMIRWWVARPVAFNGEVYSSPLPAFESFWCQRPYLYLYLCMKNDRKSPVGVRFEWNWVGWMCTQHLDIRRYRHLKRRWRLRAVWDPLRCKRRTDWISQFILGAVILMDLNVIELCGCIK